jgi:hypothetical protein
MHMMHVLSPVLLSPWLTSQQQQPPNENTEQNDVTLVILNLYDLLRQINLVSKMILQQNMQLDMTVQLFEQTLHLIFVKQYRESRYDSALITAKEIASELYVFTLNSVC